MSIQSDVEILSIQAVEHYAKLHNLSEIDAVNLFHKHQVFEKKSYYNTSICTNLILAKRSIMSKKLSIRMHQT